MIRSPSVSEVAPPVRQPPSMDFAAMHKFTLLSNPDNFPRVFEHSVPSSARSLGSQMTASKQERVQFLKAEIKAFLDSKNVLSQMELLDDPDAAGLRAQILAKSGQITQYITELKSLK